METIKQFVEKYGTQEEAAKLLGVSQPTIHLWLTGKAKPKLKHARLIAEIMGKTLDDVYRG